MKKFSAVAAICLAAAPLLATGLATTSASQAPVPTATPSGPAASIPSPDLAAYRNHLAALIALVNGCAATIDASHCDSKQVGPDDQVHLQSQSAKAEVREVHYDWLRDALTRAVTLRKGEDANKPATSKATPAIAPAPANGTTKAPDHPLIIRPAPTAEELLTAARLHLVADQQAVQQATLQTPDHHTERNLATNILAESEFAQIQHPSLWNRAVEAFFNWLNDLLNRIPSSGNSRWLAWTLEWGLVIAACTGLAWWLIQGSRRERWRLDTGEARPAGAPSLRDWQLWLEEAETLAASGQWREAIHNVYWAAISRLESRGLWPVDRARTPREYLNLITANDPRREDLTTLTSGFERIWYGYRAAAEPEYQSARQLLEKLAAR